MAKGKTALEFVFDAGQMIRICEGKEKVVITSFMEEGQDIQGRKIGIMRVKAIAKGKLKTGFKKTGTGSTIEGCPIPPCNNS